MYQRILWNTSLVSPKLHNQYYHIVHKWKCYKTFFFSGIRGWPSWLDIVVIISNLLHTLNSSLNFFIYCYKDDKFRASLMNMIKTLCRNGGEGIIVVWKMRLSLIQDREFLHSMSWEYFFLISKEKQFRKVSTMDQDFQLSYYQDRECCSWSKNTKT